MIKKSLLATAIFLLAVTSANGAIIQYFGQGGSVAGGDAASARADFLSQLTASVGTETFESLPVGAVNPDLTFQGSVGSITASLIGQGEVTQSNPQRYNTSPGGSQYYDTGAGGDFNLVFSTGISAFGFYGTDIGDVSGNLRLLINGVVSESITLDTSGSANANLLFWGFIDTDNSYTSIEFTNTATGDFFGYDDMTIGDINQIQVNVSSPATALLLGMGLVACMTLRRKLV